MHAAFVDENDLVFPAEEMAPVHFAVDISFGYVQYFDAAVKVRRRIRVLASEKPYSVGFVMLKFVNGKIFHDVNIWQIILKKCVEIRNFQCYYIIEQKLCQQKEQKL